MAALLVKSRGQRLSEVISLSIDAQLLCWLKCEFKVCKLLFGSIGSFDFLILYNFFFFLNNFYIFSQSLKNRDLLLTKAFHRSLISKFVNYCCVMRSINWQFKGACSDPQPHPPTLFKHMEKLGHIYLERFMCDILCAKLV